MNKEKGIKNIERWAEFLAYERTYGRGPSGYAGRLYAQTIGARMFQREIRIIPNHGLEIRDFDLESAHFDIAAQTAERLVVDIERYYSELAQLRDYIKNGQKVRQVLVAARNDASRRPPQFFKNLCTSAPHAISVPVVHEITEY